MRADERLWRKCDAPFFPRRTVNGGWTRESGQTWCRKTPAGRWEYQQDLATLDEIDEHAW